MKTNVNRKPQGHSAKRWHGMALPKDPTALRQTRPPRKKESSLTSLWKQSVS